MRLGSFTRHLGCWYRRGDANLSPVIGLGRLGSFPIEVIAIFVVYAHCVWLGSLDRIGLGKVVCDIAWCRVSWRHMR